MILCIQEITLKAIALRIKLSGDQFRSTDSLEVLAEGLPLLIPLYSRPSALRSAIFNNDAGLKLSMDTVRLALPPTEERMSGQFD